MKGLNSWSGDKPLVRKSSRNEPPVYICTGGFPNGEEP